MSMVVSMPAGMWFRKMYCAYCGTQLKRKKIKKVYHRGEPGFQTVDEFGHISFKTHTRIHYVYCCPGCQNEVTYRQQLAIDKEQAKQGSKIIYQKTDDTQP